MNKIKAYVMALVLIICAIVPASSMHVSAAEDGKVSQQSYDVYYAGKHSLFLCNKKTIGNTPGTEYYMTYTVKSVKSSGKQNGFLGTSNPDLQFPYTEGSGTLYYLQRKAETDEAPLLLQGYTYFIKFTVTQSGYRYLASRAKGDNSEYVVIEGKAATGTPKDTNYGYFGIWFGDGVTDAQLTNVRFYDKAGNDLGAWSPWQKATVVKNGKVAKDTKIDHWYRVSATNLVNLAISNEKPCTTDKMYMEYSVSENTSNLNQNGISFSNYPENTYPHQNGYLRYKGGGEDEVIDLLLQPGADYLIVLEKGEHGFNAYAQITKDGKTTIKTLPSTSGTYDKTAQYFSLWFGAGNNYKSNFVLENVKFYDAKGNNLGVQSNNTALQIRHFGSLLDYEACEGVYYCEEDESTYTLYKDQKVVFEKESEKAEGTYSIRNNKITLVSGDTNETYDYLYRGFKAKNNHYYKRLYTYQISFVAGNGDEAKVQIMDMKNGYRAKQPTNPKLDGYTFEGWCTFDRAKYNFDKMVTESKTLYAKWSDDAGIEYIAVGDDELVALSTIGSVATIAICAILLVAAIVGSVFIVKRGVKNEKKNKV